MLWEVELSCEVGEGKEVRVRGRKAGEVSEGGGEKEMRCGGANKGDGRYEVQGWLFRGGYYEFDESRLLRDYGPYCSRRKAR